MKGQSENSALEAGTVTALAVVLLLYGLGIRLYLLGTPLWLDEIWSVLATSYYFSSANGLSSFQSDNNHLLNTLWLSLFPVGSSPYLLRLPAFLASVLVLADLFSRVRKDNESFSCFLILLLFSLHPFFIVYSTEARGYGMAIGFLYFLFREVREGNNAIRFSIYSCGAIFAHPASLSLVLPLSVYYFFRQNQGSLKLLSFAPLLFGGLLYTLFWQHWPPGTGGLRMNLEGYWEALSVLVAGPEIKTANPVQLIYPLILSLLALLALLVSIFELASFRRTLGALYLSAVFIVPLLIIEFAGARVLYPRYFFPQFLLMCFLFSEPLLRYRGLRGIFTVLGILLFVNIVLSHSHLIGAQKGAITSQFAELCGTEREYVLSSNQPFRLALHWSYFSKSSNDFPACSERVFIKRDTQQLPEFLRIGSGRAPKSAQLAELFIAESSEQLGFELVSEQEEGRNFRRTEAGYLSGNASVLAF